MTTSKPDGAGPTVENFNKASECWDVIGNMTDFREATRERVVEVIAQYLSSERVEAEKKIEELEQCISSWKKEELIWKDLELRFQAARNVAIKYRTIWGELAEPVVKYSEMHIFVDKEIEAELSD